MKISAVSPVAAALLVFLLSLASPALGQSTTTETKVKKIPFHGKLQASDATAQTVTLASKKGPRVFHLTSDTKIVDGAGNPTTLASAVVGEDVGGSYTKDASGNMMLNSLRLGAKTGSKEAAAATPEAPAAPSTPAAATPAPKPAPAPAASTETAPVATTAVTPAANTTSTKAKKQRFSGTVVSVDATVGTLVVHGKADQTFTVTSSTKITGADNLGAIAAGAKVSGSYEKSADGATLTVISLKVAK